MADCQTQIPVINQKHGRKRYKKLYSQIREQMEFYFSDANLQKDRFLKQKVEESSDGYVDLDMFLRFNKIRQLTSDITTLTRALSKSAMLKLNGEKTKIRRTTPIAAPTDVDERTVYVECLPLHADHNWLKNIFSSCGKVVYISMPRYKSTNDIRGFAFIEFDSQKSAKKACELLNNPPASAADKPIKFPKNKDARRLERQLEARQATRKRRASESQAEEPAQQVQPAVKRRRTVSESHSVLRREKTELSCLHEELVEKPSDDSSGSSCTQIVSSASTTKSTSTKLKQKKRASVDSSDDDRNQKSKRAKVEFSDFKAENVVEAVGKENYSTAVCAVESSDDPPALLKSGKKVKISSTVLEVSTPPAIKISEKRKKEKKNKKARKKMETSEVPELRVISKLDWLKLRNDYLALQKSNMAELKNTLKALKQSNDRQRHPKSSVPVGAKSKSAPAPVSQKDESASQTTSSSTLAFLPDTIVHVTSDRALNRKDLKASISNDVIKIAYIDLVDGDSEAHIRCSDAASASALVKAGLPGCQFHLLAGEDERHYWDKAAADRQRKLDKPSNKLKHKNRRGRDKIQLQVDRFNQETNQQQQPQQQQQQQRRHQQQQHIVFDD